MLDIIIIAVGQLRIKAYMDLANEYQKRLKPYARIKIVESEPVAFQGTDKIRSKKQEGIKITEQLKKIKAGYVVFLEEKGMKINSLEFAGFIGKFDYPIIFVIGGALGIDPQIDFKPHDKISLSPMTFNHELARVVLLEQIYRAATIINGKQYHY
jgi:23S rRNA (pseudouridine1915-N3)-methyltransferase